MKKILLLITIFSVFLKINSQTTLLKEDFESYQNFTISNIGLWQTLDLDQLNTWALGGDFASGWVANWPNAEAKMAFQIFNPSVSNATNDATGITGEMRNFDPHSGQKYAGSWAGKMLISGQGNNDWLISPAVKLGNNGNILSLYIKSMSNSYGNERYQIGVYSGAGSPTNSTDFTIISNLPYELAPYPNWGLKTFNLDSYSGQTIKIGIHCITQEAAMLMVDDVKIETSFALNTAENSSIKSKIFPNPSKGEFTISSSDNIELIEIYDETGKLITKTSQSKININNAEKGNYFIKITHKNGTIERQKILKK